jgi:hypothetical protein
VSRGWRFWANPRARLEVEVERSHGRRGAGARFGEVAAQGARRTPELGGKARASSRGELHGRRLRRSRASREGSRLEEEDGEDGWGLKIGRGWASTTIIEDEDDCYLGGGEDKEK